MGNAEQWANDSAGVESAIRDCSFPSPVKNFGRDTTERNEMTDSIEQIRHCAALIASFNQA